MKIVAIIPSRYGSTRFRGKPLALISGKPMIQRVYENVRQADSIADVLIATDDQRIYNAAKAFKANVIMTSEKNRSGTDRVAQVAEKMGLGPCDIVVNVQGDQPLIDPRCLDEVVRPLELEIRNSEHGCRSPDFEMSTLAFRIVDENEVTNPKDVKAVFDSKGFALYFSRSPIPCSRDPWTRVDTYKHLGIYAYTRRFLETFRELPQGNLEMTEKLEQLRALEHGHKIMVVISEHDSPEVDLPEDIDKIEDILS